MLLSERVVPVRGTMQRYDNRRMIVGGSERRDDDPVAADSSPEVSVARAFLFAAGASVISFRAKSQRSHSLSLVIELLARDGLLPSRQPDSLSSRELTLAKRSFRALKLSLREYLPKLSQYSLSLYPV